MGGWNCVRVEGYLCFTVHSSYGPHLGCHGKGHSANLNFHYLNIMDSGNIVKEFMGVRLVYVLSSL